jgi:hypothetical protein
MQNGGPATADLLLSTASLQRDARPTFVTCFGRSKQRPYKNSHVGQALAEGAPWRMASRIVRESIVLPGNSREGTRRAPTLTVDARSWSVNGRQECLPHYLCR